MPLKILPVNAICKYFRKVILLLLKFLIQTAKHLLHYLVHKFFLLIRHITHDNLFTFIMNLQHIFRCFHSLLSQLNVSLFRSFSSSVKTTKPFARKLSTDFEMCALDKFFSSTISFAVSPHGE